MKSQRMQEEYEKQLHDMEETKNQALEELTEYYEAKLHEKTTLLEEVGTTHMPWAADCILFLILVTCLPKLRKVCLLHQGPCP